MLHTAFCESSLLRTNHSTLQRGMLHTAAEGGTATEGDRGGGGGAGEGDLGVGEGPGGGGGRRRERRLVPWIPRPKLIPKWDGMYFFFAKVVY